MTPEQKVIFDATTVLAKQFNYATSSLKHSHSRTRC